MAEGGHLREFRACFHRVPGVNLVGGYALAHLRFPGSTALFFLALATLMIPVQVIMVPLFQLVPALNLYGT